MKTTLIFLGLAALLSYPGYILAHEGHDHDEALEQQGKQTNAVVEKKETASKAVEVGNKICPVSGDKIPAPGEKSDMGDKPVKYEYNGKIYNLCCPMCIKDFKKNPEKYSKIADEEVAKEKNKDQKIKP